MPEKLHIVKEGEWLGSIARQYGFPTGEEIYQYEKNKPLRDLRPDPDVIHPGDEIWIPPCPYEVEIELPSTGGKKQLAVTVDRPAKEKLDMILLDADGEPMKNTDYLLRIGGYSRSGRTDGDGRLVEEFDGKLLDFGRYSLQVGELTIPLHIGHLDPIDTVRGLQARLNNLGYECGMVDGISGQLTWAATRRFQRDHGLVPDSVAGKETLARLKDVYGG